MRKSLEFRGSSTVLFGDMLLLLILGTLTLGLYLPWGIARLRKTILTNTYYDDRPLRFDGTGGELFGIWIKVWLLSIITLGIYALLCYPEVAILKWDAKHTILPDGTRLEYRGTALDLFGQMLVVGLLSAITLGIYSFWGIVSIRRHVLGCTFAGSEPLEFTGTGGQYLGLSITVFFLTLITLGIYSLLGCAVVRQVRWDAENTLIPPLAEGRARPYDSDKDRPIQVNVTVNR